MASRGAIENRARAAQIRDYSGLRWGKITPTDIDGFTDFQDRAYVFIELKCGDADLPHGQRLALERLCHCCQVAGKFAVVFVARHNEPPEEDIYAASAMVEEIWWNRRLSWKPPQTDITLKEAIDKFLTWADAEQSARKLEEDLRGRQN